MATKTKVFHTNKTQAVRLAKEVAFPPEVSEVSVVIEGSSRIISPVERSWDAWFDDVSAGDDFLAERNQPVKQQRESLDD